MEKLKKKCQQLDQAEYSNLLEEYPQFGALFNQIRNIATTKSVEVLTTEIEKYEDYQWSDSSHWFNQVHGFSSSFIETQIDLYCEEQEKTEDELTELDYGIITDDIISSIDCNCISLDELIIRTID